MKATEIFAGNWDACSLAAFLTAQFALDTDPAFHTVVSYDCGSLRFVFDPPLVVDSGKSNCQKELGFWYPPDVLEVLSTSNFPINLSGVNQIKVDSNLSVYNLPPSGVLCALPFQANYGEMFHYYDTDGSQPVFVSDHHIQTIEIKLLDQFDNSLSRWIPTPTGNYASFYYKFQLPTWRVHLTIETLS